jgi:hypothetical protein
LKILLEHVSRAVEAVNLFTRITRILLINLYGISTFPVIITGIIIYLGNETWILPGSAAGKIIGAETAAAAPRMWTG